MSAPTAAIRPRISVIIPMMAGEEATTENAFAAVRRSSFPPGEWELIAVADGDSSPSATAALARADVVVRLPGESRGAAYACNRGVEVARAPLVLFLEPTVAVRADTLRCVVELFQREPDVAGVVGSFDDTPARHNVASQYRGLLEHFVHQRSAGDVSTLWGTCAAVRRDVFTAFGGFDEWHFRGRQLEGVDLGRRLVQAGYRVVLEPRVRVTELRRWTLSSLVRSDFRDRGVPWGRLVGPRNAAFRDERRSLDTRHRLGVPAAAILSIGALAAPTAHRYSLIASMLVIVLGIAVIDREFYGFLLRRRGVVFTLVATPLHIMTYVVSGFAIVWGRLLHALVGPPDPDPVTQAFSEMGVDTWPPVPRRPIEAPPTPVATSPDDPSEPMGAIARVARQG